MDLSVVVPLYNESESLGPLYEELARALAGFGDSCEMVFVDDGSDDGSETVLRRLKQTDGRIRVIRLARNSGQTAALACGFAQARGQVIVAIDADGENDPADIARLRAKLGEEHAHLIQTVRSVGYRFGQGGWAPRWHQPSQLPFQQHSQQTAQPE